MKKTFVLYAIFMIGFCCCAKELKVLMIGNSFSGSVLTYLPSIVKVDPENTLEIAQCGIAGCTMKRHCMEFEKSEKDPDYKPYFTNLKFPDRKTRKASLQELLKANQWDIVTIQQGSYESWQPKTFVYAKDLIGIIRKYLPKAEIVIQQTWAYRLDDPRITFPDKGWKIGQQGMYDRLTENYRKLAEENKFRVIPTGYAVQLAREKSPVKFKLYDPEMLKTLQPPALPDQKGDVVGTLNWVRDRKTGNMIIRRESVHLNNEGKYLQACVWYMFLFDKKASDIKFVPKNFNGDAGFLAKCAEEAIADFPQVKK